MHIYPRSLNGFPRIIRLAGILVFLTGLSLQSLLAQSTGSISGIVTDPNGGYLQGASVKVEGTNLSSSTDRTGRYRIDGVPTGARTVTVDYLGYDTTSTTVEVGTGTTASADINLTTDVIVLETFRVESVAVGQGRAINQQRTANTISNIISSDAIGNLPDRTIAEALGRLPGVNVVGDQYASIRGTTAQYNSVTLDGDRITTAGDSVYSTQTQTDNRAVDLSLLPAEMVGSIQVIKALTPDMDADSFGGTINLVTRSAFDLKNRSINGKFEFIRNDFKDKNGHSASLTYLDVLNEARTVGLSATFSYRKEDRWTDSYEMSYYDPTGIPIGNSGSGSAGSIAAVGDEGIEEYDTRLNFSERERYGGSINLDWKVSDLTELHFRLFYESNENDGGRFRTRFRALSRWSANSTAELASGQQIRLVKLFEDGTRENDVIRLGFEGKSQLGDGSLTYGLRYGDSNLTAQRDRYIFEHRSNTQRRRYSWTMDRSNPQLPSPTVTKIATGENGLYHDLADLGLSSIRVQDGTDDETDWSGNLDYELHKTLKERPIDWKFGAKFHSKDRSSRPTIRDFTPPGSAVPDFSQFSVVAEPSDLFDGTLATMGPYVSLPEVMDYFRANQSSFGTSSGDEVQRLEARKYDVSEDVFAGYAMATTKFDKLEVIAGVRWEATKTGYVWLADPSGPSSGSKRYDQLYPSVLFNYRFNENFVLRLAYTNTLSRPSYGDLIPYRVLADTHAESGSGGVEPDDFPETNKVFLGNADLQAQQSENFDVSLEYYFKPTGLISVALFRKDLSDIIYRAQWKDPADPNTIYFQDRNGSKGKVEGVEISLQQSLKFLPSPLDGLGVNVNATFINGSSVLEELVPGSTNTYQPYEVDFLPEQPETVYNVQVWWEKYGITARIALNYVDEFVRTSGGRTSFSKNYDATRIDASLSYRLTENFIIYVEGRNLTEEVDAWYATSPNRPEDYTFEGKVFSGGVKFRF